MISHPEQPGGWRFPPILNLWLSLIGWISQEQSGEKAGFTESDKTKEGGNGHVSKRSEDHPYGCGDLGMGSE
jgi:hypothetical protein